MVGLNFFFKVLVILEGIPAAAPGKTVFGKEPVGQVVLVYLMFKGLFPVHIALAARRGDFKTRFPS